MKAEINLENRIHNFHADDYDFGNREHPHRLENIKGFAEDVDIEEVKKGAMHPSKVFKFYLEDGIVKNADVINDPRYIKHQEFLEKTEFETKTDCEIIRAARELLQVPEIRKLLSDNTQQRLANAELQVEQIKDKYK